MANEKPAAVVDGTAPPPLIPSKRFILALLVFMAFIVQYSQRVNLPIAIVCMINRTQPIEKRVIDDDTLSRMTTLKDNAAIIQNPTQSTQTDKAKSSSPVVTKGGIFNEKQFIWSELEQQMLLGSYWAGYIFTQVPGGWLATNIGAKWVYGISLLSSSIATAVLSVMYIMPTTHFILIFCLRCIIGLAHGVLFPATVSLWSVWAVPTERSTLASIGFSGTHLGTAITMLTGGLLCRYLNSGWMYLFAGTSVLGFIWFILWLWQTADSPSAHKTISAWEREYICTHTGSSGKRAAMSLSTVPWKNIFTSKPLIALMITHVANLFGLFFFLTNLGKILTQIHKIQPQTAGSILCLGFFLTFGSSMSSGILTDRLVRSKIITLTVARKIFNSLTSFVPVLCMISLCFCDETRQPLGIVTVLIYLAISGLGYGSGYVVNFADVAPAYSGLIFGLANTLASLAGLIGNIVAGIVVKKPILEQWRPLFIMFGTVYFIGGLVYLLFGSAVPRKWAKFQPTPAQQEKTIEAQESVPLNATSTNADEKA